jgi:stage IV sporulation protein FB
MNEGAITLFRLRGIPVRMHWSLPVIALLVGGFRFAPGAWLGWILVVLLHELGHAFWVVRYRMKLADVFVHGAGGHCDWSGNASPWQRCIIAWGGIMGQAVLGVVAFTSLQFVPITSTFVMDLAYVLTWNNLFLVAVNLIPLEPLDGVRAWRIGALLRAGAWRTGQRTSSPAQKRAGRPNLKVIEGGANDDDQKPRWLN